MAGEIDLVVDHLSRLEHKVDRLNDAVIALARVEEQIITLFRQFGGLQTSLTKLSERIAALERSAYGYGLAARWAERIMIVVITALLGPILKKFIDTHFMGG